MEADLAAILLLIIWKLAGRGRWAIRRGVLQSQVAFWISEEGLTEVTHTSVWAHNGSLEIRARDIFGDRSITVITESAVRLHTPFWWPWHMASWDSHFRRNPRKG